MRPVTTIPKEKIKAFKHRLVKTLNGNHNMAPEAMIDALNGQIIGWANFYRFTDYTGKIFRDINSATFWKLVFRFRNY